MISYQSKRRCGGMADATDSKSVGSNIVWVQVPPPAPVKGQVSALKSVLFNNIENLRYGSEFMNFTIEPIAHIYNNYKEKFGIPRQSGIENESISEIVFCDKYRDDNSLRGLEGYSHIWLLWMFSKIDNKKDWSPTVRPPRLGGNKRMGVFSTRSPFHPNKIGLSCVRIVSIDKTNDRGTVIRVSGADLLNETPIIDIKPYLSFTDSHPDAVCGFADEVYGKKLDVTFEVDTSGIDDKNLRAITDMLGEDPRPSYQENPDRIYSMTYSYYEIKFSVKENILIVKEIINKNGCE